VRTGVPGITTVPASTGLDSRGILEAAAAGRITTLLLLGADPLADFPDAALAARALERATVIAVDLFVNDSGRCADVILAAAGPTEVDGSFTNLEGRVTALRRKVTAPGTARADWEIAAELAQMLGADLGLESVEGIWDEIGRLVPTHAGLARTDVESREGVLVTGGRVPLPTVAAPVVPPVDAYSFRLVATRVMYDGGTTLAHSPSSAHLAPGTSVALNPVDFAKLGVAAGDDVTVTAPKGSLRAPARADAGVPRGAVALTVNQPNASVHSLIDASTIVTDVRVERS